LSGDLRHDPLWVEASSGRKNVLVAAIIVYLLHAVGKSFDVD